MPPRIAFDNLAGADLTVGAVYEGGTEKTIQGEPLHKLLPGVGNQGGFRVAGSVKQNAVRYAVLFTSGGDPDWPDRLDEESGLFTYFGDNKAPGAELQGDETVLETQIGTAVRSENHYDHLLFFPTATEADLEQVGVFDFDAVIFPDLWQAKTPKEFNDYVIWAISDHRPLWAELKAPR